MDCAIPDTLYLKANGVFPCHDDAGEGTPLGQLEDGFSLRGLLDGPGYTHVRNELQSGRTPWPGVCDRCGFFRPNQPYRTRPAYRLVTFQVEPTLLCTLRCPSCSRPEQIRTRPGPKSLTLDRFEQILMTAVAEEIAIDWIEYCGQGEPLAHRDFHRFVAAGRRIMPRTRQRLITNGNYTYSKVMHDQHLDEIIISCDGATAETYPVYRQNGDFDRVQAFIADAARAAPRPCVIWKYILFDFNDSAAELQRAQHLALDLGVDALQFVITHSARRSERYTHHNLEQLLELTPFATVNTTPVLQRVSAAPSAARGRRRRTPVARLVRATAGILAWPLPKPIQRRLLELRPGPRAELHLDETRVIGASAIHVRGWAHDGREPFERLTLAWNGRDVGSAVVGIARHDVRRVFPRLRSEYVGFAAAFRLSETLAAAFAFEVRARSRGSMGSEVFTVQVTRAEPGHSDGDTVVSPEATSNTSA